MPTSVVHQLNGTNRYTETATYDTMDRMRTHNQPIGGTAASASFKYTDEGLLARENQQKLGKTCAYTYDACGNVTSRKNYAYTTATSLGTPTSTDTWVYRSNYPDRLQSYNGETFVYDNLGNPTVYRGKPVNWNGPQLIYFDGCAFTYHANGQRVQKSYIDNGKTITHTYTYADGKLMTEVISSSDTAVADKKLTFLHTDAGLIGFLYNNGSNTTAYYYEYNMLGDVVAIYDRLGLRVASYSYDAWGNHTAYNLQDVASTYSSEICNVNPIRYRGYYYDTQTGFYYLNTRYYDPLLCRFVSPGIGNLNPQTVHGINLYTYQDQCDSLPFMLPKNANQGASNPGNANNPLLHVSFNNAHYLANILAGLTALGGAFAFFDLGSGAFLSALEPGLRMFEGRFDSALHGIKYFGIAMAVLSSVVGAGVSIYGNFVNPEYTRDEAFRASMLDVAYYTVKGFLTYFAAEGIAKIALMAGAATGNVFVAVAIGLFGSLLLFALGEMVDASYNERKKQLFEK